MPPADHQAVVLQRAFRPFFLAAGLYSILAMGLWLLVYRLAPGMTFHSLSAIQWHAHEMLFGYVLAVISGFLLTAIENWTGLRTLHGAALALLLALWLAARIAWLIPAMGVQWAAVFDLGFGLLLLTGAIRPIIKARRFAQLAVISKLLLLVLANLVFYLGAMGLYIRGVHVGTYAALYLVLSLILMILRRILPGFIEHAVRGPYKARNRRWVDISSLLLFLTLMVVDLSANQPLWVAGLAAVLAVLHAIRLAGWYTPEIWRHPLLWVLMLGYAFIIMGFVFLALGPMGGVSKLIALHTFAVGGTGLMTLGMMARVALGHSGRDVFDPPRALALVFALLASAALVRTALPILAPQHYPLWISLSQGLWILAFVGYLRLYTPILLRPRLDGKPG